MTLQDAIEDKVGDYLLDCRLNGWEPDAGRIAEIAVAVVSPHVLSKECWCQPTVESVDPS